MLSPFSSLEASGGAIFSPHLPGTVTGKIRKGSEYPKFSSIQVPTIEKGGKKDAMKEERGDLTCHLLAYKRSCCRGKH